MQHVNARVKAKARINMYATINRQNRWMNTERHFRQIQVKVQTFMEGSLTFGLGCIPPVCSWHSRRYKLPPVNMRTATAECRMVTMCYHKLTAKKEGMTECCRDNDGAWVHYWVANCRSISHTVLSSIGVKVPAYSLWISFRLLCLGWIQIFIRSYSCTLSGL